ncbi:MAG TPA: DUF3800 domain-containing protein [Spirochaetia bacterium]|nr:DUF3800 domain-containing protein [Spirochaetia bacterium]
MAVENFYYLFLDEIYTPNLVDLKKVPRKEIALREKHHHFGIGGPIIAANALPKLNFALRKIQSNYYSRSKFPILHYVDILHTRDLYSDLAINIDKKIKFINSIEKLIANTIFDAIFTFIDKEKLILKYGTFNKDKTLKGINKIRGNIYRGADIKKYDLYCLSLKFLLINFYEYLSRRRARGAIIAESRGDAEDINLRNAFNEIQKQGVGDIGVLDFRGTINEIFIVHKKQNHAGLQLADALIYPVYDNLVGDHNIRSDHFIDFDRIIKPKIYKNKIKVFPS